MDDLERQLSRLPDTDDDFLAVAGVAFTFAKYDWKKNDPFTVAVIQIDQLMRQRGYRPVGDLDLYDHRCYNREFLDDIHDVHDLAWHLRRDWIRSTACGRIDTPSDLDDTAPPNEAILEHLVVRCVHRVDPSGVEGRVLVSLLAPSLQRVAIDSLGLGLGEFDEEELFRLTARAARETSQGAATFPEALAILLQDHFGFAREPVAAIAERLIPERHELVPIHEWLQARDCPRPSPRSTSETPPLTSGYSVG